MRLSRCRRARRAHYPRQHSHRSLFSTCRTVASLTLGSSHGASCRGSSARSLCSSSASTSAERTPAPGVVKRLSEELTNNGRGDTNLSFRRTLRLMVSLDATSWSDLRVRTAPPLVLDLDSCTAPGGLMPGVWHYPAHVDRPKVTDQRVRQRSSSARLWRWYRRDL
jgi:hypothetical protein